MPVREFLVLVVVCLVWGGHFIVMKITVNGIAEPIFYAALRMSIVALVLLPKLKWHRGQMRVVLLAGLCYGALNYAFMFPALKMTTASAAAVTIELYVPFSILLSILVFKDKIGWRRVLGIGLAFAGVVIVATARPGEAAGDQFLFGIGLIVAAAISEAFGAILVKKVNSVSPLELLAWFAVVGSLVLWPLSFALEQNQMAAFTGDTRMPFFMALTYSVFAVSIIGHASYYWLLQRLPIYIVATGGLMTTVFAVGLSAVILKETMSPQLIAGGLMTMLGVGFILLRGVKRPPAPLVN